MATVEVTITGDIADVVDQDFTKAQVRLRANTGFIADQDADKIRILDERWQDVAEDGTFSFPNVIASTGTIVAGTLQYHVDVRCRMQRAWVPVALGPYDLSTFADGVTVDLTDIEAAQPTGLIRDIPPVDDSTVLGEAIAYTDAQMDLHLAAGNPHAQYARMVDTLGAATGGKLIVAAAGQPFPAVQVGSILIYGGS